MIKKAANTSIAIAALLVLGLVAAAPASAKDRNHDRLPDRWEKRHHLSLKVKQGRRDQDHDQLNNRGEFRSGTDPRDDDTDDDGIEDGDENAGVIASFDGTTLTIDLLNGGSIAATVDSGTEIECDGEGHGDNSGRGDRSGRGSAGSTSHDEGDDGEGDDGDEVESDDDSDGHGDCSAGDLVAGAMVHEASIEVADGSAVFAEIELAR